MEKKGNKNQDHQGDEIGFKKGHYFLGPVKKTVIDPGQMQGPYPDGQDKNKEEQIILKKRNSLGYRNDGGLKPQIKSPDPASREDEKIIKKD